MSAIPQSDYGDQSSSSHRHSHTYEIIVITMSCSSPVNFLMLACEVQTLSPSAPFLPSTFEASKGYTGNVHFNTI